jgi:bifunctional enzyme CysN/CysC
MTDRFPLVVVGHVDHGKSTVIGRLLADTNSLPEGKLEQVRLECERSAKPFEWAFLLDALAAERDQGITIDTARCFFHSPKRDYVIIDAPGHIEFLKNMITGAARAEAAVLVIDAKEGVKENSRRHGTMLSLLGIRQVVVLVNKMDLVDYDRRIFDSVETEYRAFLKQVGIEPRAVVPAAAFHGKNLSEKCAELSWYLGPPLLGELDRLEPASQAPHKPFRMPVQDVYKFTEEGDERRITAGRVETGTLRVGDNVVFYPSLKRAQVKTIEEFNASPLREVGPGKSTGVTLDPELYIRPGELMTRAGQAAPRTANRLKVNIFWLGRKPLVTGKKYKLKLATAEVPVWVDEILKVLDASDLSSGKKEMVEQHEVGECILEAYKPLSFDLASDIAETGRFVLVDEYEIAGGGIVLADQGTGNTLLDRQLAFREQNWDRSMLTPSARASRWNQLPTFVLLTGTTDAPLVEVGQALEKALFEKGRFVYYLGLSNASLSLQSGQEDRPDVLRRLGETAHLFTDAGAVFIASLAELDDTERQLLEALSKPAQVLTVGIGPTELTSSVPLTVDASESTAAQVKTIVAHLTDSEVLLDFVL